MKYFVLLHSVCCLLGGLKTLRDGFVTEKDNGATFAILSGTKMMTCDLSKWTEWSSCRQLGTACRNIQTRLRRCSKGNTTKGITVAYDMWRTVCHNFWLTNRIIRNEQNRIEFQKLLNYREILLRKSKTTIIWNSKMRQFWNWVVSLVALHEIMRIRCNAKSIGQKL